MTNSIASAKCPSSVLTSGNYGMSQNRYTDDSKEYIFVKLTDSAYRAIEEYQRNANGRRFVHGQCAKIKFVGNSGIIHFPTANNNNDNNNTNSNFGNKNTNSNNGGSSDGRQFGFAIDEIEGSLECIQQNQHELDVLGALSHRMRIHANEDVYDTTRTKMAIAEETEKSKCIREIKPNQTDIGRKVKKQPFSFKNHHHQQQQQQHHHHGGNSIGNNNSHNNNNSSTSSSNFSNSLNRLKGSSPSNGGNNVNANCSNNHSSSVKMGATASIQRASPNPTMLGGSGTLAGSNNSSSGSAINSRYNRMDGSAAAAINGGPTTNSLTTASSLSSALAGGIANGYASASSGMETNSKRLKLGGSPSSSSRGAGSSIGVDHLMAASGPKSLFGGNNASNNNNGKGSNSSNSKLPDISRRKIRERLIHLLALKPFKKPELYARLQNEGLRDRERPLISNILKDISTMSRDNTYNLRRQMWNDVNENWPYYTEQELQLLKRRKPQNLTPPLSSDAGSSTSGQSPTSTHTGSPPPIVGNMMTESGGGSNNKIHKRSGVDYDESLLSSVQVKKQRISHYRKDSVPVSSGSGGACSTLGGSSGVGSYSNGSGSGGNGSNRTNYSGGGNMLAKSTSFYSPSRQSAMHATNSNDENYGNSNVGDSDLSYNILENADDFMSHLERNSGFQGNVNNCSSSANTSRKPSTNSSSNNNGSAHKTSSPRNERSDSRDKMRKSFAASSNSPSTTAYGSNFVPENKSSSVSRSSSSSSSSSSNINNGYFQRQSPNYAHQSHKNKTSKNNIISKNNNSSSSSMYSTSRTSTAPNVSASNSPREETAMSHRIPGGGGNVGISSSNNSNTSNRFQHKNKRTPTPPIRSGGNVTTGGYQRQQQQHHVPPTTYETPSAAALCQSELQHQIPLAASTQQQKQKTQQQHSSPTQQIADAASAYATAYSSTASPSDKPRYDFSNYTPITSIEQRRKYKTEFESDYDEYRKLLNQIEGVATRFRELATRLQNAQKGCPEFNDIKQQIVYEYERIRNAETVKRDKQRFDYLHEKLAYIKELVTDYDKMLTSGGCSGGVASNNANANNNATSVMGSTSLSSLMPSPKQFHEAAVNVNQQQMPQEQQYQQQYHLQQRHHQQQLQQRSQLPQQQSLFDSNVVNASPLHHFNDGVDDQFTQSLQQHQRQTMANDMMRNHQQHGLSMISKSYQQHQKQQKQHRTKNVTPNMYQHHHRINNENQHAKHKNELDDADGTSDSNDDDDGDKVGVGVSNIEHKNTNGNQLHGVDDDDDDSYSNNSNDDDDHNELYL